MLGVIMHTIGFVPGAMKPFHAGHNHLIQRALEECDQVFVFTSLKDRDIIKGDRMYKAWQDLIVPSLPKHIEVVGVKSPVGSVYDYLEWNGDPAKTYRIYGGTEDIARLSNARMLQYFPHLNAINVAESDPESFTRDVVHAKGEWVRNSIRAGNLKEFKSYLPAFLKPLAKEYLSILVD